MPEGDTLYRVASQLRPVLAGNVIEQAASRRKENIDVAPLIGTRVESVEPRGKHLLIELDADLVIHSHLGMTGSWHVYPVGEAWNKPTSYAALALETCGRVAVLFSPKLLEVVTRLRMRRNDYVRTLGPDMMHEQIDPVAILRLFRSRDHLPMGQAVMNQRLAAGIGNIYKSESLFLAGINPWDPVAALDDARLIDYFHLTHRLMRRNRNTHQRTTRFAGDGKRMWVYGRRGENCFKCGEVILLSRQGDQGRTTYWCPKCQPALVGKPPRPDLYKQRGQPPIKGCG